MNLSKLALGTATFGMNYGTFNTSGQVKLNQVQKIIEIALSKNIDTIDTAICYGESEKVLGSVGLSDWKIVSKVPPNQDVTQTTRKWLYSQVEKSLKRLKVAKLDGLLLHDPYQLGQFEGPEIWSCLNALKDEGLVSKIGYTIYESRELEDLWEKFRPDIIQAPLNLIDRRLIDSGWLDKLHYGGCEIHVRSIFLQGLLLSEFNDIPQFFKSWNPLWRRYREWYKSEGITPLEACLTFAMSFPQISKIVIGIDSLIQFEEILDCKVSNMKNFPRDISTDDKNLLNPSKWRIS